MRTTPTLTLVKKTDQPVRHAMEIAGGIREHAERLQRIIQPESHSVTRIVALCDELERSLTIQQFEDSLKLHQAAIRKDACFMAMFPRHGQPCDGRLISHVATTEEGDVIGFCCVVHLEKLTNMLGGGDRIERYHAGTRRRSHDAHIGAEGVE